MRLRNALVLLAAASLAACGGGRQEGVVSFKGQNPNTSLQKDNRSVSTHCPGCLRSIEVGTDRCPDKKGCDTRMVWKEAYRCPSCQGSTVCQACVMMEQLPDGKCFNCKGTGNLIYFGKAPECASCKGKGACPVCKGSKKCDYCSGAGKIPAEEVKSRAAASKPKEEEDAPAKPETKKEEAKPEPAKTEEAKPEEKKP